jgi:meiotically up-regulated gene 157 (Mug157) protein
MWLRDSGAQVWPYVQLANKDAELKKMLAGVIKRQFKCINIDPYANAFNMNSEGGEWMSDLTDMKPELHERKWEIDSLCYPSCLSLLEDDGRCQYILRRMAYSHREGSENV